MKYLIRMFSNLNNDSSSQRRSTATATTTTTTRPNPEPLPTSRTGSELTDMSSGRTTRTGSQHSNGT